jgi:hypothetical protein
MQMIKFWIVRQRQKRTEGRARSSECNRATTYLRSRRLQPTELFMPAVS